LGFTLLTKLALSAAAILLAGIGVTVVYRLGTEKPRPAPVTVAPASAPKPGAAATVTPHGADLWEACEQLGRNGLKVTRFGMNRRERYLPKWPVPLDLRFKPVDGNTFVETIAATYGFKVAYVRNGTHAVLYPGASDVDVARFQKDLDAPSADVRRDAVWRGGWMQDVRVVPGLVKAARDTDADVVREARVALHRVGWETALVLDEDAIDLIAGEFDAAGDAGRQSIVTVLGRVGGAKAAGFLEKWRPHPAVSLEQAKRDVQMNWSVEKALGALGLAPVMPLEKALADKSVVVRHAAVVALGNANSAAVGGREKARAQLLAACNDPEFYVRDTALEGLGQLGGEDALPVFAKALEDHRLCVFATRGLGNLGGEKAVTLLEKALADPDEILRQYAAEALGCAGGERAETLLEKALADPSPKVREGVAKALGDLGGETALTLLEKLLTDADSSVRVEAAHALSRVGVPRALDVLEAALTHADEQVREGAEHALYELGTPNLLVLVGHLLRNPSAKMRVLGVSKLTLSTGDGCWALVDRALADPAPEVRSEAALTAGALGGEAAVARLEKVLNDTASEVRGAAGQALGIAGGEKSLVLLEKALNDPVPEASQSASEALSPFNGRRQFALPAYTGNPRFQALLERALAKPITSGIASAYLEQNIGATEALAMIRRMLAGSDSKVRRGGAMALRSVKGEQSLALLDTAIADPEPLVRCHAVEVLGHLGGEPALVRLEKALGDADFRVRFTVAQALGGVYAAASKPREGNTPIPALAERALGLLGKALADANGNVRSSAADALGEIGDEKACALLLAALKVEKSAEPRNDIIEALREKFTNVPAVKDALKAFPPPHKVQPVKPPKPPKTNDAF
jgi:HEAT repeat protein